MNKTLTTHHQRDWKEDFVAQSVNFSTMRTLWRRITLP